MKKFLMLIAVLALTVCLAGCFGKKQDLVCNIDQSSSLYGLGTLKSEITAHFIGNEVKTMDVTMDMEITSSKNADTMINAAKPTFDNVCSSGLNGIKVSTCDVKKNGNTLSLKGTIEEKDIKNEDKKGDIETTKKDLEKQGYTCTIKD